MASTSVSAGDNDVDLTSMMDPEAARMYAACMGASSMSDLLQVCRSFGASSDMLESMEEYVAAEQSQGAEDDDFDTKEFNTEQRKTFISKTSTGFSYASYAFATQAHAPEKLYTQTVNTYIKSR